MPPKRTNRGANLAKLNEMHPKRRRGSSDESDGEGDSEASDGDSSDGDEDTLSVEEDEGVDEELEPVGTRKGKRKQVPKRRRARAKQPRTVASESTPSVTYLFSSAAHPPASATAPVGNDTAVATDTAANHAAGGAIEGADDTEINPAASDPPAAAAPDNDPTVCSICLEPISPDATGNRAKLTLPCSHAFHAECAFLFARSDCESHCRCPNCRDGPSVSTDLMTPHQPLRDARKKTLSTSTLQMAGTSTQPALQTPLPPVDVSSHTSSVDLASCVETPAASNYGAAKSSKRHHDPNDRRSRQAEAAMEAAAFV